MKTFLYLFAVAAFWGGIAHAQNTPANTGMVQTPSATGELSPAEQKELAEALSLVRTANLWLKTFDWKETGATTQAVVAHARQLLGAEAPVIEVRGKDESLSTFVLQKAMLGTVLCSLAELTDRQVWVFPSRLLIASKDDLTDEERAALKSEKADVWNQEWYSGWRINGKLEGMTVQLVEADLKQRLAAKGQTAPLAPAAGASPVARGDFASYQMPFGELSLTSQKALQDLMSASRFYSSLVIASDALVCLDDRDSRLEMLFFQEPGVEKPQLRFLHWSRIKPESAPPIR